MENFIHKQLISYFDGRSFRYHSSRFKSMVEHLEIPRLKIVGGEYEKKWSVFGRVDKYSYRLFSRYCGFTPDIVPEDIGHRKIETVLNPLRYRAFYSDKNTYGLYLPKTCMPVTVLRRMGGGRVLDDEFCIVEDVDRYLSEFRYKALILKPSVDSCSGRGVIKFIFKEGYWVEDKGDAVLSEKYLMSYGSDFILQEALRQHPYISSFCPTSVNTLRVSVYRSVTDEQIHVLGALMRVGKNGAIADNAHAGGRFVGVDVKTGALGNYVCDQYGNKETEWNGVDYASVRHRIPYWDDVIEFSKFVGRQNRHMRLLALDIALDSEGHPCLIEYNCEGFSYWLFMFTGQTPFGEYTDEIIDYCVKNPVTKAILLV